MIFICIKYGDYRYEKKYSFTIDESLMSGLDVC